MRPTRFSPLPLNLTRRLAWGSALLCLATVAAPVAAKAVIGNDLGTDRVIVRYRSGTTSLSGPTVRAQAALAVAGNRQGVQLRLQRESASGERVYQMTRRLPLAEAQNLVRSLREGNPDIEYAEPDRLMHTQAMPNDLLLPQQWAVVDQTAGIRAPQAWARSTGAGVVVAVVDTGIRPHLDLRANLLPGYDFISSSTHSGDGDGRDADASDPGDGVAAGACGTGSEAANSSWHGTHVAGIIAAVGGNATGVVGVAYGAKLLPVRALGRCGGYTSDIADAIVWAAGAPLAGAPTNPHPARVINLSMASFGACSNTTQRAINIARSHGAVVVVAAGNHGSDVAGYAPANCQGVITVAATGLGGGSAAYSNRGSAVTLAAPGGDNGQGILSTLNAGLQGPAADSYGAYQGTSMAAPAVAGVAALMLSANPRLTPDQVAQALRQTARPFAQACSGCGAGLVEAQAAVLAAIGTPPAKNNPRVTAGEGTDNTACTRSVRGNALACQRAGALR